MVEFNPYAYETHEDPYPIYRRLREEAPLYRNDKIGFWAVSRHADVLAAFRDTQRLSNSKGVSLEQSQYEEASTVMSFLAMDPPRHTRMRALVSRGFTPRRVAALEPRIRELATHYIDQFGSRGSCDFITEFAGKLPMDVISEMLGVPQEDRDMLRTWADTVVHREEGVAEVPPAGLEAAAQILKYFIELVAERAKAGRGDNLTAALLKAEIDGDRLEEQDIVAFLFLMIIAGNETTTKLLGNALYWAWRNPEQRAKVRADEKLIPNWVEETLRYDNSTQALARTVSKDFELYSQQLREGDRFLLLLGSGNRDERVFPEPDAYDILRDTSQMLSFGQGAHFCLGAALARLEGRVALEEIQRRIPDFEIDASGLVRVHSSNVRGFAHVPIEFTPERSG